MSGRQVAAEPDGVVRAAGAVLWRPANGGGTDPAATVEVAVVHRPRYEDWSLPKGKLDDDETVPAAAVREVGEETGFTAVLGRRLGVVEYPAPSPAGWLKRVDYFSARAAGGAFTPNDEVDELRWMSVAEAAEIMSRPADGTILRTFAALPPVLHMVLLVRHAKAGNKSAWQDDDRLRPLSHSGRQQAAAIRSLLPLFGVDRVYSAPRVRCAQTVQAVADDRGLAVAAEELLSEEGYWGAEQAGLTCLRQIAALPGTSVICSQGGVIPDMVRALHSAHGLAVQAVKSKKGSVWALSFLAGAAGVELVAADYYATALPCPKPQ